ncbi:MAG: HGGxSTG domain-containing protein [Dongiaceae bacterium]
MRNGRCRMHGGLSTGPRTPEGLARARRARLTHGGYSARIRELRAEARAHGRRVRALIALMRGRSAGHGVHPSQSPMARPVLVLPKVHHREHRAHGEPNRMPARAARNQSSSVRSVSSVVTPSPAGHGLHPSFSPSRQSPRARRLLAGAAPLAGLSAGHGVHPSFFDGRPALR